MIETSNLSFDRDSRRVLHDICLTTQPGQLLGLVGPNGAGKSTLLGTLYRLLQPAEGQVRIDGRDISAWRRAEIAEQVSVVAQMAESSLALPVRDSVALGQLARRGVLRYGSEPDQKAVDAALSEVGLADHADRLTTQLSGGELQRVLIARAIVQEASHLLLDEPTNHLDIHHQYAILRLVKRLCRTTTAVIVLHDLNLAAQFCDRIALMKGGRIIATGEPFEVLTPQRVSSVYDMAVDVITHQGHRHLVFQAEPFHCQSSEQE